MSKAGRTGRRFRRPVRPQYYNATLLRERRDYIVDNRVGLRANLVVGRIPNRMMHEDARASGSPSAFDCASAASINTSVAITTVGLLLISNQIESCILHVMHDPQSARPSMTKSHSSIICRRSSSGAGLAGVGFL